MKRTESLSVKDVLNNKSMTQVGAKQLEDLQNKQDKDGVTVCSAEVTDSPLGKIFFA